MGKGGFAAAPMGDHSGVGEVIGFEVRFRDAGGWSANIQWGHGIRGPTLALKLFGLLLSHRGHAERRFETWLTLDRPPFAAG